MTQLRLDPHPTFQPAPGPVVLVILDGVGLGPEDEGNAWHLARTPVLDRLMGERVRGRLLASGPAVGLPSPDDLGNSEVGHNALGAGRIFDQGAKLVSQAIASGALFEGETWRWLVWPLAATGKTLHLIGLWSDGNVHSHIDHAYALVEHALATGVTKVRLHLLIDGRDVGETSALDYVEPLEAKIAAWREAGHDVAVASGGGRMIVTMDRYEADWRIVERGWRAHVQGLGRRFGSASEAIRTLRAETPGIIDQNLPPFVIGDDTGPRGPIVDGDAVVFFNFRGDRAIEITRAFETPHGGTIGVGSPAGDFPYFDRGHVPAVRYAGMMQYDGDLGLPRMFLVTPPSIERTVGEYLAQAGIRQLAISETQKFGHVTYFFNGNNSEPFSRELERYVEIPSDRVDFGERPWMKAAEIVDRTLVEIDDFQPHFVRLNLPNGDMVGHTGKLFSSIIAMEAVDLSLGRLLDGLAKRHGTAIVLADHGNCEEMVERDKKTGALIKNADGSYKPRTSHTTNPVPCVIVGPGVDDKAWAGAADAGLSNVAATVLALLGFAAPDDYRASLLAPRGP
ncbi:MAG: 2,3-bisphosphoglycerate-independent phosphoglycerate mutase [Deltaproteobacteria bacterium]|nr:2,3-bisphosphoglycerate-independent phosphoglycerate mutase [Deltaproteobacteria bacterium]